MAPPGKRGHRARHADAAHGIVVACGDGTLRIAELQKPGGKRLDAEAFLKGFAMEGGSFEPV